MTAAAAGEASAGDELFGRAPADPPIGFVRDPARDLNPAGLIDGDPVVPLVVAAAPYGPRIDIPAAPV